MKKDRNAFFSEYGFNSMQSGMNQGMPNMGPNMVMPPEQVAGSSNFYAGPAVNPNMGQNMMPIPTDIDSRLSKIERQLNRLETRVSKIEGDTGINPSYNDNNDYNYANSMYMV